VADDVSSAIRTLPATAPGNQQLRCRLARVLAAASLALAGCGGGIVIGLGSGYDDFPPDVSLVINVDRAFAGDVLRLSAAASDDYGVDAVEFYRIEPGGSRTFLGADGRAPWTLDTPMPDVITSSGGNVARYIASAVDGAGQISDSTIVAVQQLR
jgi:hypothetical protein